MRDEGYIPNFPGSALAKNNVKAVTREDWEVSLKQQPKWCSKDKIGDVTREDRVRVTRAECAATEAIRAYSHQHKR